MSDGNEQKQRDEKWLAEDYKRRLLEAMEPVIEIMNEAAREHGMQIEYNVDLGQSRADGKRSVVNLRIVKIL